MPVNDPVKIDSEITAKIAGIFSKLSAIEKAAPNTESANITLYTEEIHKVIQELIIETTKEVGKKDKGSEFKDSKIKKTAQEVTQWFDDIFTGKDGYIPKELADNLDNIQAIVSSLETGLNATAKNDNYTMNKEFYEQVSKLWDLTSEGQKAVTLNRAFRGSIAAARAKDYVDITIDRVKDGLSNVMLGLWVWDVEGAPVPEENITSPSSPQSENTAPAAPATPSSSATPVINPNGKGEATRQYNEINGATDQPGLINKAREQSNRTQDGVTANILGNLTGMRDRLNAFVTNPKGKNYPEKLVTSVDNTLKSVKAILDKFKKETDEINKKKNDSDYKKYLQFLRDAIGGQFDYLESEMNKNGMKLPAVKRSSGRGGGMGMLEINGNDPLPWNAPDMEKLERISPTDVKTYASARPGDEIPSFPSIDLPRDKPVKPARDLFS